MDVNLFQGRLVRLGAEDPETMADAFHRWSQDMDYYLPLDSDPPRSSRSRSIKPGKRRSWKRKIPARMRFSFPFGL